MEGVIDYDVECDFCILKIDAKNLPVLSLGNSYDVAVGEKIYCIGNPLGFEYTFSDGMLSGVRDLENTRWLQFTAPISPGNSGGPIVNRRGEVLGIATFLVADGQNMNFALAIDEIKAHINTQPQVSFAEFAGNISEADYYFSEGQKAYLEENYEKAAEYYRHAAELNPDSDIIQNNLGTAYLKMWESYKAIECFERAVQLTPHLAAFYNNLGSAYLQLNQHEKARENLEKALQLDPSIPNIYVNLGGIYFDLGQYEKDIEYLEKALELDPNFEMAHKNMGSTYLRIGRYQRAIESLERAIQINPNSNGARNLIGIGVYWFRRV